MRESYDTKIWRLQNQGKISKEYAQELMKKHREELDKRRMFSQGDKITSLEELLKETWVICYGRTWHIKALMNMQLRCVLGWLETGHICKAIKKHNADKPTTDDKSDTPTETDFKHFTAEQVRKMSQSEVRANYSDIMKSMKLW